MLHGLSKVTTAGLVMTMVLTTLSQRSEADVRGIVLGQPILMPTPDPIFQYQVGITLQNGYSLTKGDYITISGFMDETGGELYNSAGTTPALDFAENPPFFVKSYTPATDTFKLGYDFGDLGTLTATTPAGIFLGTFLFDTDISSTDAGNLSKLNAISNSSLSYTSDLNSNMLSTSNVIVQGAPGFSPSVVTPEPGVIALLLSGLPVAWIYYRRRKRSIA